MRLLLVDAFADRPFTGNPAGVCLLDGPAPARWMQDLAAESNLSETAFLHPQQDGWALRWFTPTVEVPLCGHATLASAHVLLAGGHPGPLRFATRSGVLVARSVLDGIELDLPANPPVPAPAPPGLLEALGVEGEVLRAGDGWWLVVLEHEEQVRACAPDVAALAAPSGHGAIVTAPGSTHFGHGADGADGADGAHSADVVSRVFAPGVGIDEDPVTGAAHCVLAPYWAARSGRDRLRAHQASRRGGDLVMQLVGDRVLLTGVAVTVATLHLADAALPPSAS